MQIVYEAANSIDARIVAGLLESHGLECRIDGEHLQGAMGELPVMGLVRVLVDEADAAAARELIEEREQAFEPEQPRPPTEARQPGALWVVVALALVAALWLVMQGGGAGT